MLVQTVDELNVVLESLRAARGDHQWIEAKRARSALPVDLWKSLSALANAGGGLVLLGVDEQRGGFAVTGVEDAAKASAEVQAVCRRAEPPLRPAISVIGHDGGQVIVAHIPGVPRLQQPCHFRTTDRSSSPRSSGSVTAMCSFPWARLTTKASSCLV